MWLLPVEATLPCSVLFWEEGEELYSLKPNMHLTHSFLWSQTNTTNK